MVINVFISFLYFFANKAKITRTIVLCTTLFYCLLASSSSEARVSDSHVTTDSVEVFFRLDKTNLDSSYYDNGKRLSAFAHRFDSLTATQADIRSVLIVSGASPEGPSAHNRFLSDSRAAVVRDYLVDNKLLDINKIEIESRGVDWHGLAEFVKGSNFAYKDDVLEVLALPEWIVNNGKVVDSRKNRLMTLNGGKVWRDLYSRYFAELRHTRVMVAYNILRADSVRRIDYMPSAPLVSGLSISRKDDISPISLLPVKSERPFYMALKTNMLYDALLVPNIGLEFYLGRQWSIAGNWMYAWWKNDRVHNYWRTYGGDIEVRRLLGTTPLRGHHFGLYGQILTYDFELGGRGYLGDRWTYAAGISYGYSMPISRRLNIDFSIGIGYLHGKYKEYLPQDGHYVWQSTKMRNWIGPTKVEVSLVWLLGKGNYNRKGGAQ